MRRLWRCERKGDRVMIVVMALEEEVVRII